MAVTTLIVILSAILIAFCILISCTRTEREYIAYKLEKKRRSVLNSRFLRWESSSPKWFKRFWQCSHWNADNWWCTAVVRSSRARKPNKGSTTSLHWTIKVFFKNQTNLEKWELKKLSQRFFQHESWNLLNVSTCEKNPYKDYEISWASLRASRTVNWKQVLIWFCIKIILFRNSYRIK